MRCSLGELAVGATAEIELEDPRDAQGIRRQRRAGRLADAVGRRRVLEARATATVRGADVRLTKTSARAGPARATASTFTLTARSRARVPVSGVRMCDRLPDGLAFVAARAPATAPAGRAGPCACAPATHAG